MVILGQGDKAGVLCCLSDVITDVSVRVFCICDEQLQSIDFI